VDRQELEIFLKNRKLVEKVDLRNVDLIGADLTDVELDNCDMRGANFSNSNLRYANLSNSNLTCANLNYAALRGANLSGCNLSDVNLRFTDLRFAELKGANLCHANLNGCIGNHKEIKSISIFQEYPIAYTKDVLQIGCEQHPIQDWWNCSDQIILEMDGKKGLRFWRKNKEIIKQIIEHSPAI
jgi:hypothetical protein